jgi:hypothetical protein
MKAMSKTARGCRVRVRAARQQHLAILPWPSSLPSSEWTLSILGGSLSLPD